MNAGCSEKAVDLLAFETLIPKSVIQRYVSLLLEHRRIILSGPSGTGKTYLTQKLADYIVSLYVFCLTSPLLTDLAFRRDFVISFFCISFHFLHYITIKK